MKKLVLAGIVAASLFGANYTTGYKYKNTSDSYAPHRYESTEIKCSNGNVNTIYNYYNLEHHQYIVDVTNAFRSFEEAANFICDKSESKSLILKDGAVIFMKRAGDANSIVSCLRSKYCVEIKEPVNDKVPEGVRFIKRAEVGMVNYYPQSEIVEDKNGDIVWNVLPSESSKIKKNGYKKVMLKQGYYEIEAGSKTYFVPESEIEK